MKKPPARQNMTFDFDCKSCNILLNNLFVKLGNSSLIFAVLKFEVTKILKVCRIKKKDEL